MGTGIPYVDDVSDMVERNCGPEMAGAPRGLRAGPFEAPYTFLRNEPNFFVVENSVYLAELQWVTE